MISGVIFDLDGTLLNTLEDLTDSVNYSLVKYSYPKKTLEQVRNAVGNGVRVLFERLLPGGADSENFEEIISEFKEYYKSNMYNKTCPYDGIMEMLKGLKLKGIQTAVVSNKFDAAVKELCKKYFGDLIHLAIGENEAEGIRKKPAPDCVFRAIEQMRVSIEHVIYVGDSETDVQTARNSEIDCIGCTWGFRDKSVLQDEGVRYIIELPGQIFDIIKV